MESYHVWLIALISGFCVTGFVILFHFVLLDDVIQYEIGQQFALKNGSEAWDRWVDTPVPVYLKVYLFVVTNAHAVASDGAKPKLREQGPYVYREVRKKKVMSINEQDDTITYNQEVIFHFDKELSGKLSEHDVVTVINPAVTSLANILNNIKLTKVVAHMLGFALPSMFGSPASVFLKTTVKKFLFDGERIRCSQKNPNLETLLVCAMFQSMLPIPVIRSYNNGDLSFAVLRHKNGSGMGELEVNAGIREPRRLGEVVSWKKQRHLKVWAGDPCNQLNGGHDFTLLSPNVNKQSRVHIFSEDLCSTVSLEYKTEVTFKGISGLQFKPIKSFLADELQFPENACYCNGSVKGLTLPSSCLPNGAIDVSPCADIPAIITKPHFLDAASVFLDAVDGLKPDPEKHSSFVNLEPRTGVPLEGYQRVQLNVQVNSIWTVEVMSYLPSLLFPVLWLEEGSELDDKYIGLLNEMLFDKLRIIHVCEGVIITISLLLTIVAMYYSAKNYRRKRV